MTSAGIKLKKVLSLALIATFIIQLLTAAYSLTPLKWNNKYLYHNSISKQRGMTRLFSQARNETDSGLFLFKSDTTSNSKTEDAEWDKVKNRAKSYGIIPTGPDWNDSDEKQEARVKQLTNLLSDGFTSKALKYFNIVDNLSPNELLMKFASNAPRNVQAAAKGTIMNILGSLPNYALDASLITTNTKLANLLYQMQITGYMFKNAEYQMSMTKLLKGLPKLPEKSVINKGNTTFPSSDIISITGEVVITNSVGEKINLDVNELTDSLGEEVKALRNELANIRDERENELKSNLLTYIQALPEKDLIRLTSDMSEDLVQTMQLLVGKVIDNLGLQDQGPDTVIQQNAGQLAQLCMWQIVVGYKLREIEVLEKGAPI